MRGQIGRSTRNSNPAMTSSAGGAKGCSDHRFDAPPAYTVYLLALHEHSANNKYRTANQIWPILRVSSSTTAQRLINLEILVLVRSLKSSNFGLG